MQKAEFTVSRHSKAQFVAGAIAARARERIDPVVTAIGEEAVCIALMAICRTRLYLAEDQLDVRFLAYTEEVEKEGHDGRLAILDCTRLKIYVEEVESSQ